MREDDHAWLDQLLSHQPQAGAVIAGTGGVRKLRMRLAGRGKSGGARVIYYYHGTKQRVYLILAYAKNVKESLSEAEKQHLRRLTATLEAES